MGLVLQGADVQALLLSLRVEQEADGGRSSPSQVQLLAGLPPQARMEAAFGPSAGRAAPPCRGGGPETPQLCRDPTLQLPPRGHGARISPGDYR